MEEYIKIIKNKLSHKRYIHSLGVAETAKKLAELNGVNGEKGFLAGILHDYAKELSNEDLLVIARENNLITDEVEIFNPQLLHGPVGAYLIEKELGINNQEIIEAIRFHTTGKPAMGKLTQIIYIADLIEPSRDFAEVNYLRKLTFENLTKGVFAGLNFSIKYVLEKKDFLHTLSVQTRNWFLLEKKKMKK